MLFLTGFASMRHYLGRQGGFKCIWKEEGIRGWGCMLQICCCPGLAAVPPTIFGRTLHRPKHKKGPGRSLRSAVLIIRFALFGSLLMPDLDYLVVATHPDDDELCAGGT